MLEPVIALIAWTLLVWLWMYAVRIPAISKANIQPDDAKHPDALKTLPSKVRAVADNYNHLHEQPTVFYALAFYTHLAHVADSVNVNLAWGYVVLRVLHSLVQNTANKVMLRFMIFALSSLALIAITVRNLLALC